MRLDARVPMVWRDPFSLQFGVDPARVILRDMSTADERVIRALTTGMSRSGIGMIARSSGASARDLTRLLDQLEPVLLPEDPPPGVRQTVGISGAGRTVELIAETLVAAGVAVDVAPTPSESPCDFGIAVGHYVLDPAAYGHWLRRDVPHLAVTFGDADASVGPFVEPGRTACLYCVEFHRRDADASWPAIASQLWGRQSAAETPLVAREVAALTARIVLRGLRARDAAGAPTPAGGAAASIRLDVDTGDLTRRDWMPHPACGCVDLATSLGPQLRPGAARPGSDSGPDSVLPTRVVAVGGPG